MNLTLAQKRAIRDSFPDIREVAGPLSLLFYGRLFELDPSLRPMFKQDIEVQGRKLMDMLSVVVENLDHLEGLVPVLHAMGQRHAGYGVKPEHYPTLSRALSWALGQALGAKFYPECKAAWMEMIAAVSTGMMEGAAELRNA